MKLLVCVVVLCAMVFNVCAVIPTAAECKDARDRLTELTADDYKALKAKTKTNEQVGDALLGYADNEESVAGKFVLLQDAFQQYVLGKSVDKADSTYSKALTIGGVEYALEMTRPARTKLLAYATLKNAPAKALKDRIGADKMSFKRVGDVKTELKNSPKDKSLCEKLGIEYAAIGDWESALKAFVTASGEISKIAAWELDGSKSADYTEATVGAFWWKFAANFSNRKNVEEAMKLHAAMWYKLAIDKDAFKGNEKTIIEKRIAETEEFGAAEQQAKALVAKKIATLDPIRLKFSKDNIIELIGCPAGEFMMGDPKICEKDSACMYHKVKITRPFWMSKFKVTHKVWSRFEKIGKLDELTEELGGWNCVHRVSPDQVLLFFEWLNKTPTFRKLLPEGYVFRLPTEAEWEYALNANATDSNDLYVRARERTLASKVEICVSVRDARERDKKKLIPKEWYDGGMEVGTKKPNNWGFYDMLGNVNEVTLDTIDENLLTGEQHRLVERQTAVRYEESEIDPLRYFGGVTRAHIARTGEYWNSQWGTEWFYKDKASLSREACSFRIVIGPDLMKEKGYSTKAKTK